MPVVLDPKSIKKSSNINLVTSSNTKLNRINRLKEDLDKFFVENTTQYSANTSGLPYIDLYGFPIDVAALTKLTKEQVQTYQIGVFGQSNKELSLATPNPNTPGQQAIISQFIAQGYTIKLYICSDISLQKIIKTYSYIVEHIEVNEKIELSEEELTKLAAQNLKLTDLSEYLSQKNITEIIQIILISAVQNSASDIHLEPEESSYVLRFRLDGVLHTFATMSKDLQHQIESRIKLLAKVKLNVDNVPQDGRFSFIASGKQIDVRVSMLPSNYGYSIVMRLLGQQNVQLDFTSLGLNPIAQALCEEQVAKSQGLILVTGPTGSGKTTTLYTFLSILNTGENKIITLEDPIEYKINGISQTQIDPNTSYTFANGLKSVLRQDPNIVMIGEIREEDTAQTAVQASLTGHKVLSTLHTNDATGAIPRLIELGVKGYVLADSLSIIIGQRLVRKLCPYCKHEDHLTVDQKSRIINELAHLEKSHINMPQNLNFFTSSSCKECNGVGYKGRVGVFEVLTLTPRLKDMLIQESINFNLIRSIAQEDGMITIFQDGILKALEGQTDIKEVIRVLD